MQTQELPEIWVPVMAGNLKVRRPILILVGLVLGTAILQTLTACSRPEEPVRIGVLVWPPYELAYLAREKQYFDTSTVELVDFLSPAEMVRNYRFGLIDAMFVTSQFSLTNAENLIDSRIIYVVDFSAGGDSLMVQPEIESLAELEGKKVGVEAGPLGAYTLERALESANLSREDIELVFLDTPDQKTAFETGRVDAVATYEPIRSQLLKQGATELFNSREIPLEIIDVVLAKKGIIDRRYQELARFIQGVDRALQDFRKNPKDSAVIMVEREQLSVPEFLLAMEGVHLVDLEENRELLLGEDTRLLQGLRKQCEVMTAAGILDSQPNIRGLIDTRVVEAIE